jgi:squalene-associated FAD-dependent desaturase
MTARIAVVGGGLAGMSAALAAADAGADVVLIERRPSLGGLTSSIVRNGLSFDNGQHVFLRCCTAYMEFLERVGATEAVYLQPRLDLPVLSPGGARSRIRRMSLPAPLHLLWSLGVYRHLSLGDRARLGRAALALRRLDPDDPALDRTSFGQWLRHHGQSERAIENLWNLIALPTLNLAADEASLALATKVFRLGLLDRADGGDIGWSKVPLAELHGEHGARALDAAGVETVLGSPAGSIVCTAGAQFEILAADRRLVADAVIVATPPRVTAALLAPFSRGASGNGGSDESASHESGESPAGDDRRSIFGAAGAERLGSSPIVNVHLVLDRRVTDLPLAACVGSPIQFLFDRTSPSGAARGTGGAANRQCLGISLSAADSYIAQGSADLTSSFFEALGEILPAARRARLVSGVVTRERAATFRAAPGSRALRPQEHTSVAGLFLAGAWCDTGWPATMEGAVRSGAKAASAAVALVSGGGRRRPTLPARLLQPSESEGADMNKALGAVHLEEART